MILGERIKKVRKNLDLTQQELGKRIGIKPNSISLIESGNRNASEQVILSICREFNVSETWLRTGEGEMFKAAPVDALDALIEQYGLPHELRILAEKFMALKPDAQEVVINYVRDAAAAITAAAPAADQGAPDIPPGYSSREELEAEADEFAAIARQQFLSEKRQELEASSAKKSGGPGGVA